MAKILGIDLGTTNSAMAIVEAGEPRIIENAEGARTTPSVVAISKTGDRLVGVIARRQAITNPQNTIYGIKRFIGHRFDAPEVQRDQKLVGYEVKAGTDGGAVVTLQGQDYRPEEISAMILQKLKADAEAKLGETITEAVITVPAYFDDAQRKATADAGKIAGLDVKRVINEPTAAALAYGFNKKKEEKIVVYDFGGGTFDVTVLEVGDDVIEVRATGGDSHMGGRDIDYRLIKYIADEFKKAEGIDLMGDPLAVQRLDEAAEKAKQELSNVLDTEVNLPFITSSDSGPKHLLIKISRSTLEGIAQEYVEKSIEITKDVLEKAKIPAGEIDEVVLVGGQTRMPLIIESVKQLFNKEPNRSINPDEVVALGAGIQAGILQGDVKDILLVDVIPLSFGLETMGGVATKLVEANTAIPTSRTETFSTASDNQTSVEINIVQGERALAKDNKSLGRFILDGIPPAPRGVPQVEVTFDVDASGILNVSAKDKATGKEQSIRIEASSGLTDADIERMKNDAAAHAEDDRKEREKAEARNIADQLIYTAEKSLSDHKDKIPEEVKTEIEAKISGLRIEKESGSVETIKAKSEELSQALMKIGESMKNENPAPEPSADAPSEEA
jgi:molecular chaperone DnaK